MHAIVNPAVTDTEIRPISRGSRPFLSAEDARQSLRPLGGSIAEEEHCLAIGVSSHRSELLLSVRWRVGSSPEKHAYEPYGPHRAPILSIPSSGGGISECVGTTAVVCRRCSCCRDQLLLRESCVRCRIKHALTANSPDPKMNLTARRCVTHVDDSACLSCRDDRIVPRITTLCLEGTSRTALYFTLTFASLPACLGWRNSVQRSACGSAPAPSGAAQTPCKAERRLFRGIGYAEDEKSASGGGSRAPSSPPAPAALCPRPAKRPGVIRAARNRRTRRPLLCFQLLERKVERTRSHRC